MQLPLPHDRSVLFKALVPAHSAQVPMVAAPRQRCEREGLAYYLSSSEGALFGGAYLWDS